MIDESDFIIIDYYCKKTNKHKPQRWVMHFCTSCNGKRSHLPRNRVGLCASCSKDLFLINKLGVNYKQEVALNEKLKNNLRTRLNSAIKNNFKTGSAVRDLGCSIENFKKYIESKFEPWMNWSNHGIFDKNKTTWQLDHIVPLNSFDLTNREELLKAFHYSNYQPLETIKNLSKGKKICG